MTAPHGYGDGAVATFVLRTGAGVGVDFAGSLARLDGEPQPFAGLVGFLDAWRRLSSEPDPPQTPVDHHQHTIQESQP